MFHVKPEYIFLKEQILKYGDVCHNDEKFIKSSLLFLEYLLEYNKKVNLISRKDEPNVIVNQWLHSLLSISVIEDSKAKKILDFGSGGGFPGILLALYFGDIQFTLVESIAKKSKFLDEVSFKLGLKNIKIITKRVENLSTNYRKRFDIVTARAVTNLSQLWQWAVPLLKPDGFLLTWKKYNTSEIEDLKQSYIKYKKISVISSENDYGLERIKETRLVLLKK
ncbi:MAG: 16S rRNA (guanine(527)-N(7))-methyltransferase RsmG [Calditrichia bacterium]|nr:16S rRNA (guanine(527)-N(7))-methyltransferase RsmG [Calditrichia bacterium]